MTLLNVLDISKQGENGFVLREINFSQQAFQKIAIAGETGSGKTTLLKIIAGLAQPDTGEVLFEQKRVKGPAEELVPGHPGIAYLSQHFELRNNYRVEEILEYANKLSAEEAATLYEVCRINRLLKRKTDQLSGGERQRIALARLLSTSPRLLLLDEPFSNLDMIHKNILKSVIRDIGEKLQITCMMISHDPLDTLSWADEILVMKDGRVIQQGSPLSVYNQPVNEYAAALFGSYNVISPLQAEAFPAIAGTDKKILIRPEHFKIVGKGSQAIMGEVKQVRFFGSYNEIEIALAQNIIIVKAATSNVAKGDIVYVSLAPDGAWLV